MKEKDWVRQLLKDLYPGQLDEAYQKIITLIDDYKNRVVYQALESKSKLEADQRQDFDDRRSVKSLNLQEGLSEKDVIVISYADSIISETDSGLRNMAKIFHTYIGDSVSAIHLLPFFDYSSDDGFSVIDYKKIQKAAGDWSDIKRLDQEYDLMFDAVINHISQESAWFQGYLTGDKKYKDYFITCDPDADYSLVTRPRALPLLSEFHTARGKEFVWTTFSNDQIDLNFQNLDTFIDILDVLLFYVSKGARYIRLDAIGFLWKKLGTTCMNLHETHQVIRLMRWVIEQVDHRVRLITETNIPHQENISYFGENFDEAHMVYQFPLPPLLIYSFISGDASKLMTWYEHLEKAKNGATFFNFIASHDGIGLRPVEGILTDEEVMTMEQATLSQGGKISYRNLPGGGKKAYELNISLLSLISGNLNSQALKVQKFLATQCILLSVIGVPGIYIHSLLGSENDSKGMMSSGINRRINREKLNIKSLMNQLEDTQSLRHLVLEGYKHLLDIRKAHSAFAPDSLQKVEQTDRRLFSISRISDKEIVRVRINVSNEKVEISDEGLDLISGKKIGKSYRMKPYEYLYIV